MAKSNDLVGKISEMSYEYGGHFKREYLKDGKVKITALDDSTEPVNMTVDMVINKIEDGRYSMDWVGDDGNTVSEVLNLNDGTIQAFVTIADDSVVPSGRRVLNHPGQHSFVKEDMTPDTRPFTNKEIAMSFWERFFNQHDMVAINDYLAPPYTQHNPHVADGIEAFREAFGTLFKGDGKYFASDVRSVSAVDDKVYIHSLIKMNPEDTGTVSMDIFRLENSKIVEHWDIQQPFPSEAANPHPMF